MSSHRSLDQMPPPSEGWAAWVRQQWGGVRVTHVKTTRVGDAVTGHVGVRASVHLGSLVPADVLVDATAEPEKVSGEWSTRLASLQSYGNGIYVFEGLLPRHVVEDRRPLIVRVRPGAAHDAFSGLASVARTFAVRTDSGRAANRTRPSRQGAVSAG